MSAAPNLLLQKLPAESFAVDTQVEAALKSGEQAGLIIMGLQHAALALRRTEGGQELVYLVNGKQYFAEPWPDNSIRLRVEMRSGGMCRFSYSRDGAEFRSVDPPFQAVEGHWIGAKVGIFCIATNTASDRGYADFDHFRFAASRP